jgi:carbamoyl-phosphate synthase small subunit
VATLTHVNLNDGVCEGLQATDANAFSVQHHPEAAPGPHESAYLFDRFLGRMTAYRQRPGLARPETGHEPVGLPASESGVA